MNRTIGMFGTVTAVVGTVVALGVGAASLAHAAPAPQGGVWYGDVDGDHAADRLTLERGADGVWSVRAVLDTGATSTAPLTDDDRIPLAGLRVTDVNSDGRDEVFAPTSVGANTTTYRVLVHRGAGLTPVTRTDGSALELYEGGGVASVNGYECPADHDGRTLDVVGATLQDGSETRYEGFRTTYAVADGVATPVHVTDVRDARADDPVLVTDPDSCASAG